jgi:hypothetical protein
MRFLVFAAASAVLAGCFVIDPDPDEPPSTPARPAQPAPASTEPAGTCAPNAACGGITSCTNDCYGKDCCSITCQCGSGDDRTHLYCSMTCSK